MTVTLRTATRLHRTQVLGGDLDPTVAIVGCRGRRSPRLPRAGRGAGFDAGCRGALTLLESTCWVARRHRWARGRGFTIVTVNVQGEVSVDSRGNRPQVTVSPSELLTCPGDTVELEWSAARAPADVTWRARTRNQDLATGISLRPARSGGRATIHVPRSGVEGRHEIEFEAVSSKGSRVAAGTATLEVLSGIHLVPSSLQWDADGLSGQVSVRNCSAVTPRVSIELRCRDGAIVLASTLEAHVAVAGLTKVTFELAELPDVQLGTCRVRLVDEAGTCLDAIDAHEPRSRPPPRGGAANGHRLPTTTAVVRVAIIAVIVWLLVREGDGAPGGVTTAIRDISCDVERTVAECTAEVTGFGAAPTFNWSAPAAERLERADTATVTAVFPAEPDVVAHDIVLEVCDDAGTTCLDDATAVTIASLLPDLVVEEGIDVDGTSDGCLVIATVRNVGRGPSTETAMEATSTGADGDFSGVEAVPSLDGGQATTVEVFVPGASFCQFDPDSSGFVIVDPDDSVSETDEGNNATEWRIIG